MEGMVSGLNHNETEPLYGLVERRLIGRLLGVLSRTGSEIVLPDVLSSVCASTTDRTRGNLY